MHGETLKFTNQEGSKVSTLLHVFLYLGDLVYETKPPVQSLFLQIKLTTLNSHWAWGGVVVKALCY